VRLVQEQTGCMVIHWPELGSLAELASLKSTIGPLKSSEPVDDQELGVGQVGASLGSDHEPVQNVAEGIRRRVAVVVGNEHCDEHTQVRRPRMVQENTHNGGRSWAHQIGISGELVCYGCIHCWSRDEQPWTDHWVFVESELARVRIVDEQEEDRSVDSHRPDVLRCWQSQSDEQVGAYVYPTPLDVRCSEMPGRVHCGLETLTLLPRAFHSDDVSSGLGRHTNHYHYLEQQVG
jgi:hypothetical protein